MKSTKEITIPYFRRGQEQKHIIKIGFVSNRVIREFTDLTKIITKVKGKADEIKKLIRSILPPKVLTRRVK